MKSSMNYAVMFVFVDPCLTEVAPYVASLASRYLPFGSQLGRAKSARFPLDINIMAGVFWLVVFTLLSAYDLRRRLKSMELLQGVMVATAMAILVFAASLNLSFRDVPRLLFICFSILDSVLLVGLRLLMWPAFVLVGARTDCTVRVLVMGAGKVDKEVARMIKERQWSRLRLTGCLDHDLQKSGTRPEGLPVLARFAEVSQVVRNRKVEQVVLTLPLRAQRKMVSLVAELQRLPVEVTRPLVWCLRDEAHTRPSAHLRRPRRGAGPAPACVHNRRWTTGRLGATGDDKVTIPSSLLRQ